MAKEAQIVEFKDSENWVMLFLKRRTTNLTTLTDDQLIQHAVDYIKHLQMSFFYFPPKTIICASCILSYIELS